MRRLILLCCAAFLPGVAISAQTAPSLSFTRADTLRGSNGPGRAWWDATFYDLHVAVHPSDSTISGWNGITYRVDAPPTEMQIDLQEPLVVDSMIQAGERLTYRRDGNAFFVALNEPQHVGETHTVTVYYHGKPVVAVRPPWDGGFIWQHDASGNPWIATANEGLGASVWWPNKDFWGEEPDSQRIAITMPNPMTNVSNGRLRSRTDNGDGTTTWEWFVTSPINNYNIAVNAGTYAHWTEEYEGEGGTLTLDFWPLAENEAAARRQWQQVRPMMQCFEHWFGPFPWYEDGYKLVETPHLGMEHQSAVAYGNGYQNGYRGNDQSGSGWGLEWDFIIIHESAHEWWGNNVTANDGADMWIHESFANYSENIYTECLTGDKEAGAAYAIGTRRGIRNNRPIQGNFRVNDEGSGDKYPKGGNMLHTIRQLVNDDGVWRSILRGLNTEFRHQTVTGNQVEHYIASRSGLKLDKVFDQYLRTTMIPVFEYAIEGSVLSYRWSNVVPGFDMPIRVTLTDGTMSLLHPTEEFQTAEVDLMSPGSFSVDENFYVSARNVGAEPPMS